MNRKKTHEKRKVTSIHLLKSFIIAVLIFLILTTTGAYQILQMLVSSTTPTGHAISNYNSNLIFGYVDDTMDNTNQWIWTSLQGTATAVKVISITDNAKYIDFSKNTITLIKDGIAVSWTTSTDSADADTIPDAFTYSIKKATYLIQVEPTASPKTVKIKTMTAETALAITNHFTSQSIATPAQTAIYTCDPTPTTGDYNKACIGGICCGTRDCKPDGSDWDTTQSDYYAKDETLSVTCSKTDADTLTNECDPAGASATATCSATGVFTHVVPTCSDGTAQGACSTVTPGQFCKLGATLENGCSTATHSCLCDASKSCDQTTNICVVLPPSVATQNTPCYGSLEYIDSNPSYPHIKNYCYDYYTTDVYQGLDFANENCGTWSHVGATYGTRCIPDYTCVVEGTSSTPGKCCINTSPYYWASDTKCHATAS